MIVAMEKPRPYAKNVIPVEKRHPYVKASSPWKSVIPMQKRLPYGNRHPHDDGDL